MLYIVWPAPGELKDSTSIHPLVQMLSLEQRNDNDGAGPLGPLPALIGELGVEADTFVRGCGRR
jgi:hypothetical protein